MGIKALGINNPIPDLSSIRAEAHARQELRQVGVFSAVSSWYKNPYVQLLALAGKPNICLHTNIDKREVARLPLGLEKITYYGHLARPQFLQIMAGLDLNLYVTNTECSPMTALESWALGVPCIVGPAGDIYSQVNDRLGQLLVEPHVDSASAIADRVDLVMDHREEIIQLLRESVDKYNSTFSAQLSSMFKLL
jgi:glycosyltransferase involved in cell wall biosynthesis